MRILEGRLIQKEAKLTNCKVKNEAT